MTTLKLFEETEARKPKAQQSAPHSLKEKLAMKDTARDDVPRRTRRSILEARFSRELGQRDGKQVLLLDSGMTQSFWQCESDSGQKAAGAMYRKIQPTEEEIERWTP